jgi:hypothetical protein
MKKLIALLLVLAMVFAFAGCNSEPETESKRNARTETTEGTQTLPDEKPAQVSLEDALSNTFSKMESGNMTVSMQGYAEVTTEQLPGLVSGMNIPLNGQFQIMLDPETKDISVYGTLSSAVMMNVILHDGWLVTYDDVEEVYYKTDISQQLEEMFAGSTYEGLEDLEDILDQIPAETLEEVEEILDVEKLLELA